MNYLKVVLLLLLALPALADKKYDCSSVNIEIKAAGFQGYSEAAKKIKSIGRFSVTTSETSTYQRSFEIGNYRFVKEKGVFAIYRKNENGIYILRKDIKYPVKVLTDQSIYVSPQDKNSLEVRRNSSEDNSTSVMVLFDQQEMYVINEKRERLLTYRLCPLTHVARTNNSSANVAPVKKNQ